jgi:hypothetical protein
VEEEKEKPAGQTLMGRVFDKKKQEPIHKPDEEPEIKPPTAKEKIKILSCGQPQISPQGRMDIPLTLEIDGQGKPQSLNLKIAIQIEQIDPKSD